MKKTIIILLIIIFVASIILAYKIMSSSKENNSISNSNIYQVEIHDIVVVSDNANDSIIIQEQTPQNNSQPIIQPEINTIQENHKQEIYEKEPQQYISSSTPITNDNKPSTSTNSNNNYNEPSINTSNAYKEENKESKLEYIVQLNTKVRNRFNGYGSDNIYWLDNGATFIQTYTTWETKKLNNPNVELRYYVESKQYKLYVEGMKTDVQVVSLNARKGNVVFPQQEYSKYNHIVQGFAGSGTINSSSTKPYFDKLNDIKNNWTELGQGRVICVSGTSYWEQIDSTVGTFKKNAEVSVGLYDGIYYMLIDGIENTILVKNYQV